MREESFLKIEHPVDYTVWMFSAFVGSLEEVIAEGEFSETDDVEEGGVMVEVVIGGIWVGMDGVAGS